jgi:hypothetical protein
MAKKRSCRRTTNEEDIHEKAVKLRKKTDEQLVHYVEDRAAKSYSEGYNEGRAHRPTQTRPGFNADELATAITDEIASVRGIGTTRLALIKGILEKHLEAVKNG